MLKKRTISRSLTIAIGFALFIPACSTTGQASPQNSVGEAEGAKQPNFLIIVVDDLGFSDLGAYGGEIATPNIDKLARDGLMLTNYYVGATCAPTRAMLLTGVDHHKAGLGNMVEHIAPNQIGQPGYEGFLNSRVVTVPERLRDAGYRTYMAGKWHLGLTEETSPAARGFEKSFALLPGGASHLDGSGLNGKRDPAPYREDGVEVPLPEDFGHSTDYYTRRMISYLDADRESDRPFFAYLAYTAPHWPLQARDEDIDKYAGVYDGGWETLRQSRLARQVELGLYPEGTRLPKIQTHFPSWEDLSPYSRRIEARRMEIFAAMVDHIDQQVGELIHYLKRTGQYNNTVIIFMSDNGNEGAPLQDDPLFANWIPRFDNSLENMGRVGSYVMIEERWAQATMTPFRYYKGMPTDGGIHVPAFITGAILRNQGQRYDGLLHVTDIAPTLFELARIQPSVSEFRGRPVYPVIGKSIVPALRSNKVRIRDDGEGVGWELFNKMAYRQGDWKVVHMHAPWGPDDWQLFNLASDPGETTDLSADHPEIRSELIAKWKAYSESSGVIFGNVPPER